jgi:hypothetical protein
MMATFYRLKDKTAVAVPPNIGAFRMVSVQNNGLTKDDVTVKNFRKIDCKKDFVSKQDNIMQNDDAIARSACFDTNKGVIGGVFGTNHR